MITRNIPTPGLVKPGSTVARCWKTHEQTPGFKAGSRAKGSCQHKDPSKRP